VDNASALPTGSTAKTAEAEAVTASIRSKEQQHSPAGRPTRFRNVINHHRFLRGGFFGRASEIAGGIQYLRQFVVEATAENSDASGMSRTQCRHDDIFA